MKRCPGFMNSCVSHSVAQCLAGTFQRACRGGTAPLTYVRCITNTVGGLALCALGLVRVLTGPVGAVNWLAPALAINHTLLLVKLDTLACRQERQQQQQQVVPGGRALSAARGSFYADDEPRGCEGLQDCEAMAGVWPPVEAVHRGNCMPA